MVRISSAPLQGAFVWGLFGDGLSSACGGNGGEGAATAATAAVAAATAAVTDVDVSFDNDSLFLLLMIRRINSM